MKLQTVKYGCHIINGITYCELRFVEHFLMVSLLLLAMGTLFRVAGGLCGGGMNQIIDNAPQQPSRRNAAVEDSGSNSEDTEADEAE